MAVGSDGGGASSCLDETVVIGGDTMATLTFVVTLLLLWPPFLLTLPQPAADGALIADSEVGGGGACRLHDFSFDM